MIDLGGIVGESGCRTMGHVLSGAGYDGRADLGEERHEDTAALSNP